MQFTPAQHHALAWTGLAGVAALVLWLLGPVLMPFVVAAVLAFLTVLLRYRDPETVADPAKPQRSLGQILLGMVQVLGNGRFAMFLLVSSGFYFIYNQVYNVLPLYVKKTVELSPAMDLYTMANPIVIVLFQLLITQAFGALGARVERLVYLDAFLPEDGKAATDYIPAERAAHQREQLGHARRRHPDDDRLRAVRDAPVDEADRRAAQPSARRRPHVERRCHRRITRDDPSDAGDQSRHRHVRLLDAGATLTDLTHGFISDVEPMTRDYGFVVDARAETAALHEALGLALMMDEKLDEAQAALDRASGNVVEAARLLQIGHWIVDRRN